MASLSQVDPFIEMEKAVRNMIYEIFTDEELLLLLRSNNNDPLTDTSADVVRDVENPGRYMVYDGYDEQEEDRHRIFLTYNNVPTVEDESKCMLFPHITNITLNNDTRTYYIRFDATFEVWIQNKLWTMSDGRFRWAQIMSRLNKIYNKKKNSISMNTPPFQGVSFANPKNGWRGFVMRYRFTTTNFLVE